MARSLDRRLANCLTLAACLGLMAILSSPARAENRMYFENLTLAAGATGEEVLLKVNIDVPILGFSFGLDYDQSALLVTSATSAGTMAALAPTEGFFNGRVDAANGLVGIGCVIDFDAEASKAIPVGAAQAITSLRLNVIGAAGTTSQLVLGDVPTNPDPTRPVRCVLTAVDGSSITPRTTPPLVLANGSVTIEDRTPRILSVSGNEGYAGQTFDVVGDFFGEPGLVVTVCAQTATAVLQPDGHTLRVTAPACDPIGFAALQVCTARGCDDEPNGFRYKERLFVRGGVNDDDEVDISDGVSILLFLFAGTFSTTCQDSLDTNDSGAVDLSDAVYLFNFLFLGGPNIPPPYPTAGEDQQPDSLPPCK